MIVIEQVRVCRRATRSQAPRDAHTVIDDLAPGRPTCAPWTSRPHVCRVYRSTSSSTPTRTIKPEHPTLLHLLSFCRFQHQERETAMETYKLRETNEKREEPGQETRRSSQPSSRGLWKLPAQPLSVPSEAQSPTSRSTSTFQSSRVSASLGTLRPSADTLQPTPQPPQPPSQRLPPSPPSPSSEPAQVAVGTLPALSSNGESFMRFNTGWIVPESEKRRRPREPQTLKSEDTTPFQPSHPSYGTSSQPSLQPPAQDLHPSPVPEPAQVIAGAPP
ncbi:hypothetical protein PENSPDRAFT_666550 [Peniophora sp. CONT]|nr:hypothetical protein PENSPDRAFT_666550 [Peniophora sp. CONT]